MSALLWIPYVLIAIWMCLWFVPYSVNGNRPLPECMALIPLLTFPTVLLMACSAIAGQWWQVGFAALQLAVQALWFVSTLVDIPRGALHILGLPERRRRAADAPMPAESSASPRNLRWSLMTLNCRFGRADANDVVGQIQRRHVDVLALQEVTPELLQRLDDAGIGLELPYRSLGKASDDDNGGTNAILSRVKPAESSSSSIDILAADIPSLSLDIQGRRVRFVSAHPKSPGRGGRFWQIGIERLAGFSKRIISTHEAPSSHESGGLPSYAPLPQETVVMGDLNSSLYHSVFRHLLTGSGLSDAAFEMKAGVHPSFPASWTYVPSMLEIDHILMTEGLIPLSISTAIIAGSDHRALCSEISMSA
ncbi:endonuclease/exonuclease/phosphatase family protein [Bifidobacterium sp.]|uniref:endonuclease/exonuclease/phosphatase family protein n=1 Tax=Bifidobacterium sp. TaxID=41200 RepID=UPI0039ED0F0B